MKTKSNTGNVALFFIVSFIAIINIFSLVLAKEIHSTKEGGNWSQKLTWINEIIPDSADNVIIIGKVILSDIRKCDSMFIMPGALLEVTGTGNLHAYTIKMVNTKDKPAEIDNYGRIDVDVVSPCDIKK